MRELFLTLLANRTAHGYEIRRSLEEAFGDMLPPLNAGQIYTTLARLERDGLVRGRDVAEDTRGKRVYELTSEGQRALERWIDAPVAGTRLKDEFFMKFVVVVTAGLADPLRLLDAQRRAYLRELRELDGLDGARTSGATAELLVEGAVLHLKADMEWLDIIEQRLTARSSL
jgi:DNA-binding PadR family transcriptional regulator